MKKKLLVLLLATSMTIAGASALAGCMTKPDEVDTPVDPNPPAKTEMTYDDLAYNHRSAAKRFCKNFVQAQILEEMNVNQADVKEESVSWYLDGSDKQVTSVTMSFIYNVDENNRTLAVATAELNTPISAQDINDGKITSVNAQVSYNAVFTFNAKDNYNNQDITNALYNATKTTSSVKLYSEAEANAIDRVFNIINIKDEEITITNVNVTKGDESKETLLKNLTNRAEYGYRTTSTTTLEGIKLSDISYTLENLGGGEAQQPDDPTEQDPPEQQDPPVEDDAPVTNADIIKFLDDNCREKIVTLNSIFNNPTCVSDGQWFISKDSQENICEAQYFYKYTAKENIAYYMVNKVEFTNAISLKNFNKADLNNVNYSQCFRSEKYDPTIQAENADLTNAICDKLFGEKTDATRFIINQGYSVDPVLKSEANVFTIIEITDYGIRQCSVVIKESLSNEGYISKLDNKSNYRIDQSKEYNISGEKLTVEEN